MTKEEREDLRDIIEQLNEVKLSGAPLLQVAEAVRRLTETAGGDTPEITV